MSDVGDEKYKITDAFESYLLTSSPKKSASSQRIDKRVLKIAEFFFLKKRSLNLMDEVRLEHLEQFEIWCSDSQDCDGLLKESWSQASILRHGKTIKTIFRKAFLTGRIGRDPTALWKLSSADPLERRRPMTDSEFDRLMELAPAWFQPVLRILGATGARGSSIARLRWHDVDFANGVLYFTSRKGGRKREKKIPFPITDEVRKIFDGCQIIVITTYDKQNGTETNFSDEKNHVFLKDGVPITAGMISTTGHRLIKEAGFKGVVLYGLRHKFATDLLKNGTSTEIARRLLGHSNERMLKEYSSHLGIEALDDAVTSMRAKK